MNPNDRQSIRIGVGAVVFRGAQILLIRRAKPPFAGMWSIPGGGLDYGEGLEVCALRELREETGVEARILGPIGVFEALPAEHDGEGFLSHTLMIDFAAEWISGEPLAGDDAAAAEFVSPEEALRRLTWDLTRDAVRRAIDLRNGAKNRL